MIEKRVRENPVFYGWAAKVVHKKDPEKEETVYQYKDGKIENLFLVDLKDKTIKELYLIPRTGKGVSIGLDVKSNMKPLYAQIGSHENFHTVPEILVGMIGFQYKGGLLGSKDRIAYDKKLSHTCIAYLYPNGTIEFGSDEPSFAKQYQVTRRIVSGGIHDYRLLY